MKLKASRRQPARRIAGLVVCTMVATLIAVPTAWASTPFTDIHSAGPLSDIYIGNDLSCQARDGGFSSTEFFPNAAGPGDCGTSFNSGSDTANGGTVRAGLRKSCRRHEHEWQVPDRRDAVDPGEPIAGWIRYRGEPVPGDNGRDGQRSVPERGQPIVFQITEVDTYVVGSNFYRTDVTLKNISGVDQIAQGTLYHAADCQLRGTTTGFGIAEPPLGALQNGVACKPYGQQRSTPTPRTVRRDHLRRSWDLSPRLTTGLG